MCMSTTRGRRMMPLITPVEYAKTTCSSQEQERRGAVNSERTAATVDCDGSIPVAARWDAVKDA